MITMLENLESTRTILTKLTTRTQVHKTKPMKNEKLVNAKEMATNNPDNFERPDNKKLNELSVGDFVKVCASPERFWVKITERKDDNFKGIVDNALIATDKHGYEIDDEIEFHKYNIYSIF